MYTSGSVIFIPRGTYPNIASWKTFKNYCVYTDIENSILYEIHETATSLFQPTKHGGTTTLRNVSCKIPYLHIELVKTYK